MWMRVSCSAIGHVAQSVATNSVSVGSTFANGFSHGVSPCSQRTVLGILEGIPESK